MRKSIERAPGYGPFKGTARLDSRGRPLKDETRGGHIKTVLQSIGDHVTFYLRDRGPMKGSNLDDVEVMLPLTDNLKIEKKRAGMTAILMANAMRQRDYPLRPGLTRGNYQLPAVLTIFASDTDIDDPSFTKNGEYSYYDLMSFIPIILRSYEGSGLGVMRVVVSNAQITRNSTNIEFYDMIIQFNLMIYGVIDYRFSPELGRMIEVELVQTEIAELGKLGTLGGLRISQKSSVHSSGGAAGTSFDAPGITAGATGDGFPAWKAPAPTIDLHRKLYDVKVNYRESNPEEGDSGIDLIKITPIKENEASINAVIKDNDLIIAHYINEDSPFDLRDPRSVVSSLTESALNLINESNLSDSNEIGDISEPIVISDISSAFNYEVSSLFNSDVTVRDISNAGVLSETGEDFDGRIIIMEVVSYGMSSNFNKSEVKAWIIGVQGETERLNIRTSYLEEELK